MCFTDAGEALKEAKAYETYGAWKVRVESIT